MHKRQPSKLKSFGGRPPLLLSFGFTGAFNSFISTSSDSHLAFFLSTLTKDRSASFHFFAEFFENFSKSLDSLVLGIRGILYFWSRSHIATAMLNWAVWTLLKSSRFCRYWIFERCCLLWKKCLILTIIVSIYLLKYLSVY